MLTFRWGPALLVSCASLIGCSTVSVAPGPRMGETPAKTVPPSDAASATTSLTVIQFQQLKFANALHASMAATTESEKQAKANELFTQGKAYLNLACSAYLDRIGTANQRAAYERQQVGIVATFVAAAMGLTGSPSKHVAGAATAFGATEASMDAYSMSYLFADAATSLRRLVTDAQQAFLTQVDTSKMAHHDAIEALEGYEALCRPSEIRRLVAEAINKAQPGIEPPKPNLQAQAAVLQVLEDLRKGLDTSPLTESQAIRLYAWLQAKGDDQLRATLESESPLKEKLTGDESAKATAREGLTRKLALVFAPLALDGNPVLPRWNKALAAIKGNSTPDNASQKATPSSGNVRI